MKTRITYFLATLFVVISLLLSSCALPSATPVPTSTPASTNTPEATATITTTQTPTLTPTATPDLAATEQVETFVAKVKEYYDAKYVSTTNGSYIRLKGHKQSWAEINYYQWEETGLSPTNFIIKSDISWKSASPAADSSGCGFVLREQPNQDNYMLFISLKGYVRMSYFLTAKGNFVTYLGLGTYGLPAQNGAAQVTLIAEDNIFRVLVNDKLIKVFSGLQGKLTTGKLAYTVVSGTNKGFGTSCDFKNTELWTIKQE